MYIFITAAPVGVYKLRISLRKESCAHDGKVLRSFWIFNTLSEKKGLIKVLICKVHVVYQGSSILSTKGRCDYRFWFKQAAGLGIVLGLVIADCHPRLVKQWPLHGWNEDHRRLSFKTSIIYVCLLCHFKCTLFPHCRYSRLGYHPCDKEGWGLIVCSVFCTL